MRRRRCYQSGAPLTLQPRYTQRHASVAKSSSVHLTLGGSCQGAPYAQRHRPHDRLDRQLGARGPARACRIVDRRGHDEEGRLRHLREPRAHRAQQAIDSRFGLRDRLCDRVLVARHRHRRIRDRSPRYRAVSRIRRAARPRGPVGAEGSAAVAHDPLLAEAHELLGRTVPVAHARRSAVVDIGKPAPPDHRLPVLQALQRTGERFDSRVPRVERASVPAAFVRGPRVAASARARTAERVPRFATRHRRPARGVRQTAVSNARRSRFHDGGGDTRQELRRAHRRGKTANATLARRPIDELSGSRPPEISRWRGLATYWPWSSPRRRPCRRRSSSARGPALRIRRTACSGPGF